MLEIEKEIYNTYLKVSRGSQGKPYTIRKDFSNFETHDQYPYIFKIGNLLKKLPHIGIVDYITAPYKVYTHDADHVYPLEFYATLKGIACYKQYMKLKEMESPDNPDQLEFITKSFRFMLKFCKENNLTFMEYFDYSVGFTPEWLKHYAERKISIYSVLDIPHIYDRIVSIPGEQRKILLGDIDDRFFKIKEMYTKSKTAKVLVKKGTAILLRETKKQI